MTAEVWKRGCLVVAGLSGAMAVGFGAYTAHGPAATSQAAPLLDLASRYQLTHALALLAVGQLYRPGRRFVLLAGWLFAIGILLFCGGLYVSALHLFSVELLLVLLPFTKLFHSFSIFISRWYNGDFFGRKGVAS